jgi:hypothetical protein
MLLRGEPSPLEIRWQDENGEVIIEKQAPRPNGETAMKKNRESGYRLFLFGVNRNRIEQMADEMGMEVNIAGDINDANLFITSKQYYRRKPQKLRDAENANLPVYVLKNNTPGQIRQLLRSIYPGDGEDMPRDDGANSFGGALHEAEDAIHQITDGAEAVELSPQSAYIRRLQHLIAERHDLPSKSTGKDPNRRVVIYQENG